MGWHRANGPPTGTRESAAPYPGVALTRTPRPRRKSSAPSSRSKRSARSTNKPLQLAPFVIVQAPPVRRGEQLTRGQTVVKFWRQTMANGGEAPALEARLVEPTAKNGKRRRRIQSKSHPGGRRFEPG
jgi:hypothetical protein